MSDVQFSDIQRTCQNYQVSVTKMPEDAAELPMLGDLKKLLGMLIVWKKAAVEFNNIGRTLSQDALRIYAGIKIEESSAIQKIIKTFEAARKRSTLATDKEKFLQMQGIVQKAFGEISAIGRTLSKSALKVYFDASSSVKEESSTDRALKILQQAAYDWSKKLSPKTKKGLALYSGWVQKTNGDLLTKTDKFIKGICETGTALRPKVAPKPKIVIKPIPPQSQPVIKAKEKSWPDHFWAKLESGYSASEAGVFTDRPRGILFNAGAGAAFDVAQKFTLGINYLFGGPYDPSEGGDKVVYDYDDARAYLRWTDKDLNLKIYGALGFRRHRNDFPTMVNPNLYASTQDIAAQWRFAAMASANLELNFEEGKAEENDYFSFAGLPGVALHLLDDKIAPKAGALFSYNNVIEDLTWGIWGGGSYDHGKFEIDLDLRFTDYPDSDEYVEEWRFDGKARLKIPVWRNLKISVFGGGFAGGTNESTVKGWEAGAGIIWEGVKYDSR